jgi:hypothetical protein
MKSEEASLRKFPDELPEERNHFKVFPPSSYALQRLIPCFRLMPDEIIRSEGGKMKALLAFSSKRLRNSRVKLKSDVGRGGERNHFIVPAFSR